MKTSKKIFKGRGLHQHGRVHVRPHPGARGLAHADGRPGARHQGHCQPRGRDPELLRLLAAVVRPGGQLRPGGGLHRR